MTTFAPPPEESTHPVPAGARSASRPSEKDARPFVTVIVTAHDRVQFLRGAVESVLAQTLDPDDFEILVVKYTPDAELDPWLEAQRPRVRTITDVTLPRLGQKQALGVRLARGEVLTFLEDDDRYLPEKLATVAERFRADPQLVYFRNRNTCIDARGRPLVGPYAREAARELAIPASPVPDLAIVDFIRHYGAEGNSSIAVRRACLLPQVDRLARLAVSTDWLVFATALAGPGSLVAGTRPLSQYRLHQSFSQAPTPVSSQRLGHDVVEASETLLEIARGTRAERAVRFQGGRGSVNWYLVDPRAPRPSFQKIRDAAWPAWLRREPTFAVQIGWCGLRLLAPRAVARSYWGYHRRDSERQRWSVGEGIERGDATTSQDLPR